MFNDGTSTQIYYDDHKFPDDQSLTHPDLNTYSVCLQDNSYNKLIYTANSGE